MDWQQRYEASRTTAEDAITRIGRGRAVFIGSGAAEPVGLVAALVGQAHRFSDNPVVHLLTLGPAPYADPAYERHFRHNAFFIGANVRRAVHEGRADYTPVFLHQIPHLIRRRRMPVDVALIQCSPPDDFGFVNLGVSVDIVLAAVESASLVIAEINPNVPVIHGAGFVPMERIAAWTWNDAPLIEVEPEPLDAVALEIGRHCAALIEDGSTCQMGIGQIPDATLKALIGKRDLGVWTEMFSDGVLDLIEAGVVTGRHKTIHPHKVSSSFAFGSKRLYRFLDRNPRFTFHPSDYINDPIRIARQHRMAAINSALQIDLTGQVCADSIGTKFYSGIGGQVDFIRGASMCPGGKPIIALRSTARDGRISRIVPVLDPGAGVVTSRGDVRYVVTEYGVADLQGKSIRERALALIGIAHPSFQAELLMAAKERRYVFVDQAVPRAEYPRRWEKPMEGDSRRPPLLLRPICLTDEEKLRELFYGLSENTLYRRFARAIKRIPHEERQYFLDVDYRTNFVLVAESLPGDGKESELVAVAQYHMEPGIDAADVAFVVRDAWQGRGLGSALLAHLVEIARANGIAAFRADVLADNPAMLRVFHKAGLPLQSELFGGLYRLRMPLGEAPDTRRRDTLLPHG